MPRRTLFELRPEDRDNRHALAGLRAFTGDVHGAVSLWRGLHDDEGISSRAVPHLVDALFDLGDEREALDLLQQLATDPAATTAHRLRAADELFYRRSYDRAQVLYATVLRAEPDHPAALLRLGQIHAWTNQPAAARDLLERRLRVTADEAATVRFYLGEALWATGDEQRARAVQRRSLAELELQTDPDFTTRSLIATMLARLGRRAQAAAAYRELVARNPRDLDLVLDYVDLLFGEGELARASALLVHGAALDADDQRLLRLRGELEQRRGDLRTAEAAFERAIELHGADAGLCSDLGLVRSQLGDWQGALASYERWLQLQTDSDAARRAVGELSDRVAVTGIVSGRSIRLGGDRVTEATVGAVVPVGNRVRWNLRAGHGHYRGATAALGGAVATADVGIVDVAVEVRSGTSARWAAGLNAAPGAPGDLPLGGFVAAQFERAAPYASVELRGYFNELWTEPAAAPGLGGRRSGFGAQIYGELPAGLWLGVTGAAEHLEIDPDGPLWAADTRLSGEITIGRRFLDGDVAVAPRFRPRRVPAAPTSPFPHEVPRDGRDWLASAWLSLQSASLTGDADLPALLPIADSDQHLFVAGRLDHHLAPGLGASLTGNIGADLRNDGDIWGLGVALTWRPNRFAELTLAASRGASLGRANEDDVEELRFEGVLRW